MSLLCKIGIHSWTDDCNTCSKCGRVRADKHVWDGCKCTKCGKTRDEQHTWDGCKCSKCGNTRDEQHTMKGCICVVCNAEFHTFIRGICNKCGYDAFDIVARSIANARLVAIRDQLLSISSLDDLYDIASGRYSGFALEQRKKDLIKKKDEELQHYLEKEYQRIASKWGYSRADIWSLTQKSD